VESFSERDVALLTAIARQAAIAIENAYLYENMRFYARRIIQAQENERKRIARELHDDTIQSLIGLSRQMEALSTTRETQSPTIAQRIESLQAATSDVIQQVRRFSQDLRPSILDDLGLLPTLEEMTSELNRQDGLESEFQVKGTARRLSSEVELTLFRIAQEALSNVRRHSQAGQVITTIELSDSAVRLKVEDDGVGFNPPSPAEHPSRDGNLGLIGMAERARLVNGTLVIDTALGHGTRVVVDVPT
jgi:signal transduction histidine kinase